MQAIIDFLLGLAGLAILAFAAFFVLVAIAVDFKDNHN